jgi:hypothetical protein
MKHLKRSQWRLPPILIPVSSAWMRSDVISCFLTHCSKDSTRSNLANLAVLVPKPRVQPKKIS